MSLSLFLLTTAFASIPVTVTVHGPDGAPVPSATIRLKGDPDSHTVDAETASWTASEQTLADGTTRAFEKKAMIELDVAAPGYEPVKVAYLVRKKNNLVTVKLDPSVDRSESE